MKVQEFNGALRPIQQCDIVTKNIKYDETNSVITENEEWTVQDIRGKTTGEWIEPYGKEEETLPRLLKSLDDLQSGLWDNKLVHCDIKPQNLVITNNG